MSLPSFDPRAMPVDARVTSWRAGDGWPMRRLDWRQAPGAESRGKLLFLGGRGDFIEKYLEAYAHWHGQGWDVTALDWRGQGGSAGSIVGGHLDSFDPLVEDCAAFLEEWLREEPGPHVAIGHSMGGHLLLRSVAEHRPAIDAFVLIAPMLGINSRPVPPPIAPLLASLAARLLGNRTLAWRADQAASKLRQANLTSCEQRFADEQWWKGQHEGFDLGPPSWGWLAAAYRSMRRPTERELRQVRVPTLLIGTEADRLVRAEAIHRAASLLPQAEMLMFQDAAHEILREQDRYRLKALDRIDAFLAKHAA
jgi:lysophospholipase